METKLWIFPFKELEKLLNPFVLSKEGFLNFLWDIKYYKGIFIFISSSLIFNPWFHVAFPADLSYLMKIMT